MTEVTISAKRIVKSYAGKVALNNCTLDASNGMCVGIAGTNGSGKSTLARIIAGLVVPDAGTIQFTVGKADISRIDRTKFIGYVAPYLTLYEEFTPLESIDLHGRLRGQRTSAEAAEQLLRDFGIASCVNTPIGSLSSGQRQRVVMAVAVAASPLVLILDEPGVTLDADGRELVAQVVSNQCARGGIVVLASNDERELSLCTHCVLL